MNILRRLLGQKKASPPPAKKSVDETPVEPPDQQEMVIPGIGAIDTTLLEPDALGKTQQLPTLETGLLQDYQHITYGQSTDVGNVRNNNQDAVLTFFSAQGNTSDKSDFGLFVVADGMGGHHDGEKASAVASQVLTMLVSQNILSSDYHKADSPELIDALAKSVMAANDMVVKQVPEGGTTVTAAMIISNLAYLVHVGDSRAYIITSDGEIDQITRDHSLVQRLIELDQLTPEEAELHPQKNVLYRALGQSDSLEVDTVLRRLPHGSFLLLCSDGLWNLVPESTIIDIVINSPSAQHSSDRLIAAANERGGTDNISAVLVKVPEKVQ